MEKEYKAFPFEIKQTSTDDKFFYFEGYAATFNNIDHGGDRILPGAFSESLQSARKVKILWQHKIAEPLGVPTEIHEDAKGLFVKGKMPKEDWLVKNRVIPQIEVGSVDSLSIGFRTLKRTWREVDGVDIRDIEKAELIEFSPVSIPMNDSAVITSHKAITGFKNLSLVDSKRVWDKNSAVKNIKEHTGSTESPSGSYRNYFMWFDGENADNFTSYKLPYADWIDGKFKAVPRALSAIKAVVAGARGGVDIPASDKPKILAHVERYLSKLEDGKVFTFEDVRDISNKEDFDRFLKGQGSYTKAAREYLAKFLPKRSDSDSAGIEVITGFTKGLKDLTTLLRKI